MLAGLGVLGLPAGLREAMGEAQGMAKPTFRGRAVHCGFWLWMGRLWLTTSCVTHPRTGTRSTPGRVREPGPAQRLPDRVLLRFPHRAAVQRVVTAMNQMDQKKHEKFANQFNYALN